MKTTYPLNQASATQLTQQASDFSWSKKLSLAFEKLEDWRLLILSASLLVQGCIVVPVLLLVSSFYDKGLAEVSLLTALAGMVAILVTNLAIVNVKYILGIAVANIIFAIALIAMHL